MLYWSWAHATAPNLIKSDTAEEIRNSICRRILIAQSLYAAGTALCLISTRVSIAVIVVVQLNYAIAPRLGKRAKHG